MATLKKKRCSGQSAAVQRVELLYEDEEGLYIMRPEDNTRQCIRHCPTVRTL
jgi:hypothetical protein